MGLRRDLLLFPGGKPRALTFGYDDCVTQDVRFVKMLNQYGMKGTFNVNTGLLGRKSLHTQGGKQVTHDKLERSDLSQVYQGHELAVHGLTHLDMALAGSGTAAYEIMEDRKNLEEITGVPVRGMAYPFGTYTDQLIQTAKSCGVAYARTIKNTGSFELPDNFLCWHPTCHHSDTGLFGLADRFLEPDTYKFRGSRLFYVWGHTYEFDVREDWDRMERFLEKLAGRDGVWYASNIEICDYLCAVRQLRYSATGRYIENPTLQDIWLAVDGNQIVIPSGKVTEIPEDRQ